MDAEKVKLYASCDRAIKAMNRECLEAFTRMKMADWDEVNVIRRVVTVYRESAMKARKRYKKVAYDGYLLGLMMCGWSEEDAEKEARKAITYSWVDDILERTDFVTLYRFNSEAERKAYRLAESLEVSQDRVRLIDKALKDWSRQLGQYAITYTDESVLQAFKDAGIKRVVWLTEADERVCHSCREMDGMEFPINEVPPKPHIGCRCLLLPVLD